jgi:hypothetical protein
MMKSIPKQADEEYENGGDTFQPSDAAFFFSLICFVPWMKFLSITSSDCHLGDEDDEDANNIFSDDQTLTLASLSSHSSSSLSVPYQEIYSPSNECPSSSSSSTSSLSLSKVIHDSSHGWSVFQSRRKNSLDDSASIHSLDCSSPRSLFQRSPTILMKKQHT